MHELLTFDILFTSHDKAGGEGTDFMKDFSSKYIL